MEPQREPEKIVALFANLVDVETALHALQEAGVPYPDIHMGAHSPADLERATLAERADLAGITAPANFWSLAVVLDQKWREQAIETLREHHPFAFGQLPSLDDRRDDTERGAIAWRHYVFESPSSSDWAGESAGTTGFTGITNSGVFASDAHAEGNPPTQATPASDERPSNADREPTTDTMEPKTSTDRSRPETELKQ